MENVAAIHSKNNIDNFNKWLKVLDNLGYNSTWTDMNAKDYGIPQSRNRTFVVSILSKLPYKFPEPIELKYRFKDYLEKNVSEDYYVNNDKAKCLIQKLINEGKLDKKEPTTLVMEGILNHKYEEASAKITDICPTILSRDWKGLASWNAPGVVTNE